MKNAAFNLPARCAVAAIVASFAIQVEAQSLREQLVGTWKLAKWTYEVNGTERPTPFGPNPMGQLIYSSDGYMCAALMQPERARFASKDWRGGTAEEKVAAFDTYTGYCGPYVVNEAEHYVVHTLEEAAYPNWSRSLQKRFLELKDGNMTMKTPLILIDGNQTVGVLVWEKVH